MSVMIDRGPFPGVDPWLERSWGDVGRALLVYLSESLNRVLPRRLVSRLDVRTYRNPDPRGVAIDPDIGRWSPATEPYLEVRDFDAGGAVVTAIEVVSRADRCVPDAAGVYRQMQRDRQTAKCGLIEIDLLRVGDSPTLAAERLGAAAGPWPHHVSTLRPGPAGELTYVAVGLRSPLPPLVVPLGVADADVVVPLQPLYGRAYSTGRYGWHDDYRGPADPPLSACDDSWARDQVASWRADLTRRWGGASKVNRGDMLGRTDDGYIG